MKQIQITQYGAPEVLVLIETAKPMPSVGQVLVKVRTIGVNYADVLRRQNRYFMPTPLPYVIGTEAVGTIEALGPEVDEPLSVGKRVLAILPTGGAYSEYVTTPAAYCVPLPDAIDDYQATAIFVQGTTAQLMIAQLTPDLSGKTVLINAAAGGVGSLLVQLAKQQGARVMAASSSDAKLQIARSLGADALINYSRPNWGQHVREANQNQGVDYVFEMVGGEVYNQSVKALAQGGQIVLYGCASGIQGSVHPEYFVDENLSQTGFNLAYYITTQPTVWQQALGTVIGLISQNQLRIETPTVVALADAAAAHQLVESRQSAGKVVLTTQA